MKKISYLFFSFFVLLISCRKSNIDKPTNEFPSSAETKPQYDNTSFGVYKGVIIGSTGTIVVKINNGDNVVKAYLSIDNKKDTLSTVQQLTSGQPIVGLAFTGKVSSFTFSVDADGNNTKITNLLISGHPKAMAIAVHENSTKQVRCYEGTFTGDLTGNICFIRTGTQSGLPGELVLRYLAKKSGDTSFLFGQGIYDVDTTVYSHYYYGSTIDPNPYFYFAGKGKFDAEKFSGYWTGYSPATGGYRGNFSCSRTY